MNLKSSYFQRNIFLNQVFLWLYLPRKQYTASYLSKYCNTHVMYNHDFEGVNLVSFKERNISDIPAKDKYVEVTHKKSSLQKWKK